MMGDGVAFADPLVRCEYGLACEFGGCAFG